MSEVLTKIVHDCSTGVTAEIPLTPAEIEQRKKDAEQAAKDLAEREAEAQAKADAKLKAQAKLQALGLTGEEIAAITEQVIKWQQRNIATCSPT